MSRAPNHEFQEWWNKQRERNHDLFSPVSDDDPSTSGNGNGIIATAGGAGGGNGYHAVEIRGLSSDPTVEKSRARSARQIRFFCFLKLQQIASSFASLAGASLSVLRKAYRRVVASPADSPSSRLYRIIRFFLILVIVLLGFELLAYYKGWHFSPPRPSVGSEEFLDWLGPFYAGWLGVRAKYLALPLQSLANVCIILFLIQSVYWAVLVLGCLWIKIRGIKPEANVEYGKEVLENGHAEECPMVLVQVPMCNEKEMAEDNENSNVKRCRWSDGNRIDNGTDRAEDDEKKAKGDMKKPPEPPKDYIHVRARRGQATDSHSLAERVRREKISERMKLLQDLVPGCNMVAGKALMLDEIINYVRSLQRQVEVLSMKLASVNTSMDFNMDALMSNKDMFQSNNSTPNPPIPPLDSSAFHGQNISDGTVSHCTVDPIGMGACRSLDACLPPINDHQYQNFYGGDLQSIMQMGFDQITPRDLAYSLQPIHGSAQASQMKVER